MFNEKDKTHAEASYLCNVYTFIGIAEGWKLSALEVMHSKRKSAGICGRYHLSVGVAWRCRKEEADRLIIQPMP